jgi:TnpA family transposase
LEKKESNFGKKGEIWKKKDEKKELKKKKRNALLITIVIYNALGVGEQWIPHTL